MKNLIRKLFPHPNTGRIQILDHNPQNGESLIRFVDSGKEVWA